MYSLIKKGACAGFKVAEKEEGRHKASTYSVLQERYPKGKTPRVKKSKLEKM